MGHKPVEGVNQNPRKKVVMVVANALTTDVRVQKTATSVAIDFDVLVIGISRNSFIETFQLNGLDAVTIPWDCWKRDQKSWYKPIIETQNNSTSIPRRVFRKCMKNRYSRRIGRYLRAALRISQNLAKKAMETNQIKLSKVTWRHVLEDTMNINIALFPIIESFKPDIIHVHDIHLLGLVKDYVSQPKIGNVKVIYDAHEYIRGLAIHDTSMQNAFVNMESECISIADAVITVSEAIADQLLLDHYLEESPKVILNAPNRVKISNESKVMGIRKLINLDPGIPLAVYSGGVHPIRGIDSLIYALEKLKDLHLALTINREGPYTDQLIRLAEALGVEERLHFVPYVDPSLIVEYLASANIGVSPLPASVVNFDLALPNKIFDYFQCEIPVVTSNCVEVSKLIEELKVGELYEWDSLNGLVQALRKVMDNLEKYREPYLLHPSWFSDFTWEVQEVKLLEVYKSISY